MTKLISTTFTMPAVTPADTLPAVPAESVTCTTSDGVKLTGRLFGDVDLNVFVGS